MEIGKGESDIEDVSDEDEIDEKIWEQLQSQFKKVKCTII